MGKNGFAAFTSELSGESIYILRIPVSVLCPSANVAGSFSEKNGEMKNAHDLG
jgi:hypothetical protein